MRKIKGDYWKASERTVKLQIKTRQDQNKIQEMLPGWECVGYGYIPKTSEDIYVFEREFNSELDWNKFLNSDKVIKLIEMREVEND